MADMGELGRPGSQSTPASLRRELWRETQQQSVGSVEELCEPGARCGYTGLSSDTGPEDYLSPLTSSQSPQSSFSSPQVSVDSPRISFSPLHIKDSIEEAEEDGRSGLAVTFRSQSLTVPGYCTPPTLLHPGCDLDTGQPGPHHQRGARGRASAPGLRSPVPGSQHSQPRWPGPGNSLHPGPGLSPRARSVSPISLGSRCTSCPRSPVPGAYFGHYEQFFRQRLGGGEERPGDVYRRWMSDTDISSDCLDTGAGANISHSQDIQDTDNVFYNQARSGLIQAHTMMM